jgi:nucleotide-binding universal stress UspA family protein
MGPHTMLDEGIEPCLDLIKETADINAVLVYSQAFQAGAGGIVVSREYEEMRVPNLRAAFQGAGVPIQILEGTDAVETLLEFAKSRAITQLFIGHTQQSSLWSRIMGDPVDKLIRRSQKMDVRIFPQ